MDSNNVDVLVVGAGIMGEGIVQIAAQAGHKVWLYDVNEKAALNAKESLAATFAKLVTKKKISEESAKRSLDNIYIATDLNDASQVKLVVEAIVEDISIKRNVFAEIEKVVSENCILASNTSSISVTAIANGLKHPSRLVGMHFFNPVPLMRLVEVVSGLQTSKEVAKQTYGLAVKWGKTPVYARSTPGFIVNRIARPFYAEALSLLQEQACSPSVLDACVRAAGFRMGPCELMDLIGHDTNFAVTKSVYEANFYDKRFTPSIVQRELVEGGLLGRKSKQGFFNYGDDAPDRKIITSDVSLDSPTLPRSLTIHGTGRVSDHIKKCLDKNKYHYEVDETSSWQGLAIDDGVLRLCDGLIASQLGDDVAVFDLPVDFNERQIIAYSTSINSTESWSEIVPQWLALLGFAPQLVSDVPGLVVARTIAMIINEAADAVHQGVCTESDADDAMKLGVNYPAGPFEWLSEWSAKSVTQVLSNLDDFYKGERYRISPWLQKVAWSSK